MGFEIVVILEYTNYHNKHLAAGRASARYSMAGPQRAITKIHGACLINGDNNEDVEINLSFITRDSPLCPRNAGFKAVLNASIMLRCPHILSLQTTLFQAAMRHTHVLYSNNMLLT